MKSYEEIVTGYVKELESEHSDIFTRQLMFECIRHDPSPSNASLMLAGISIFLIFYGAIIIACIVAIFTLISLYDDSQNHKKIEFLEKLY